MADPARLAALKEKLLHREGKPEFKESCKAIRAEIQRIQAGPPETPTSTAIAHGAE